MKSSGTIWVTRDAKIAILLSASNAPAGASSILSPRMASVSDDMDQAIWPYLAWRTKYFIRVLHKKSLPRIADQAVLWSSDLFLREINNGDLLPLMKCSHSNESGVALYARRSPFQIWCLDYGDITNEVPIAFLLTHLPCVVYSFSSVSQDGLLRNAFCFQICFKAVIKQVVTSLHSSRPGGCSSNFAMLKIMLMWISVSHQ